MAAMNSFVHKNSLRWKYNIIKWQHGELEIEMSNGEKSEINFNAALRKILVSEYINQLKKTDDIIHKTDKKKFIHYIHIFFG